MPEHHLMIREGTKVLESEASWKENQSSESAILFIISIAFRLWEPRCDRGDYDEHRLAKCFFFVSLLAFP